MGILALCPAVAEDACSVLLDVGGTTTDVALFAQGSPVVDRDGMSVRGRRTLVRSLASLSIGVGGDSLLGVEGQGAEARVHTGPLREGPAIVQYIADQVPDKQLAPANGTLARYRLQEWLTFIGTELHKGFSPLFNPATPEEYKPMVRERLLQRLLWVDSQLAGKQYLMGDQFTVADGYLFTVTNWTQPTKLDISGLAHLAAYRERVGARPAVQAAMKAEGLLK